MVLGLSLFTVTLPILQAQEPAQGSGLRYPIDESNNYPFSSSGQVSPLYLKPPNVDQSIVYDPETNTYVFSEKVGKINYRTPSSMTFEQYQQYHTSQLVSSRWYEKAREESGAGPAFMKKMRLGNEMVDRVFGTDAIKITPQGSAELIFGYSVNKNDNPAIPLRNRKTGSFVFKNKMMMNVTGSIGDKMELALNYNTEATFDFENKTKLEYSGKEDEIIKKIEAGDVTFQVPGTLITGSQSLFGIKTDLQFGKLTISTVVSHQRGESSSINVQGGAQQTEYEVNVADYDANRHFFLSHFFQDNYNDWLKNLPHIESQVQIQQVEVWVVNKQDDFTKSRNVLALMDLGEGYGPEGTPNFFADERFIRANSDLNQPSDNELNALYGRLENNDAIRDINTIDAGIDQIKGSYAFETGRDYINLESARPLSAREYSLNKELGYISLNSPLRNDEVLAVSFVYTYRGRTYRVGELSSDVTEGTKTLIVKLLKGITQSPKYPAWDLMMKNIYSIGAYQVDRDGFVLNVLYRNDNTGKPVNYIFEPNGQIDTLVQNRILLEVMNLDALDSRNEPNPDGIFDFMDGVTINSRNGRVIFPLTEPFGADLRDKIVGNEDLLTPQEIAARNKTADKYVFEELYDSTQTKAKQVAEKNKFMLQGLYRSSGGSDIQLNAMNVPKGSVKVTAGGIELIEGQDFTVDYTLGRVKILNQGLLESGTPIRISLESNSLFNFQTKTLLGTHLDYRFSENFNVGGTLMRLTERPLTEKVNMGDEPISNTIWGLNTSYRTESQFLTNLVDKLPLIETKEPSSIAIDAEFAHLIPGQSKKISKEGVAYIDDFEAAKTEIEIKSFSSWFLASPPKGQPNIFINADQSGIESGYNRGHLAWYTIDPVFYGKSSQNPLDDGVTSHYERQVKEKELFPQKDEDVAGFEGRISTLNLAYYPQERGSYNFNINEDGSLKSQARDNWGGIMREITTSDFETSNIEYLEFWLMDPYVEMPQNAGGDLYIHLGEVSEDVLRDSRKSYENGLPITDEIKDVDTTVWGRVPRGQSIVDDFANDPTARERQDIGLDGLNNQDEYSFFLGSGALPSYDTILAGGDVAADDYKHYLSGDYISSDSVTKRYKYFNNMDGNSPSAGGENTQAGKSKPDVEDINDDNTLNTTETYYQYHVKLRPEEFVVGKNYIVDQTVVNPGSASGPVTWYQFRIPIGEPDDVIGEIEDFKSIRFLRMVMTDFEEHSILRFATLRLVRGEWRRYNFEIRDTGPLVDMQTSDASFEVSAVNIEENSSKTPIPYVLPPGITRVSDPNQPQLKQLNEQSLLLKVKNLEDYDGRAVFKNVQLDLRQYKRMKMFIHAEALPNDQNLKDYDVHAFIRFGSDYKNNYYEYEVPLQITAQDGEYTPEDVWPDNNTIDLLLSQLVELKKERNLKVKEDPRNFSKQVEFIKQDGNNTLKVMGNPNLSNIQQIMLGVRNPGDGNATTMNDGDPKSAELWFNELRLTDFNNKGGWAANGRVQLKLADLGIVNLAGATSTAGFGSIDQKVGERQKEQVNQYDISTNLELGKLFPEKAKVSIPMYFGISKTIINPEYFPQDPDVKFKDVLAEAETKAERDSLKRISQDYTSRKSINFTNVRWNKDLKKGRIVSPSNFTIGAAFSETQARSYTVENNIVRKYGANFNYVFNVRPKAITPFRKSKALRKPNYRIIRDINFNPHPSRFTFGTQFNRDYQYILLRNIYSEDYDLKILPTVSKDFTWDRRYTLKWDLTRSLKFDYSATNLARIDEPIGESDWFSSNNDEWKDTVWNNITNFGRNMQFSQKFTASYTLPLNKIPVLNWTNFTASYDGNYFWNRGPVLNNIEQDQALGHTIKNSNTWKLSGNLNMKNLYNKVGYFKKLDNKYKKTGKKDENKRYKTVNFSRRTFFKKDEPKRVMHKLGTQDLDVKVYRADGTEVDIKFEASTDSRVEITASEDITGATVEIIGRIERGENPLVFLGENTVRFFLGIKSINASWSRTSGTVLPGYRPETNMMGLSTEAGGFNGAPGLPFIIGWHDRGFPEEASVKGWLTTNETFSTPIIFSMNETFNFRTQFEPFKGFRIDLTAMRSYSESIEQNYYYNGDEHVFQDPFRGGNFRISVITIGTAFEKVSTSNQWESKAFNTLKANREVISRRFHGQKVDQGQGGYSSSLAQHVTPGYVDGYGPTSQEVLIPAFLSAYTGKDPNNVTLKLFPWNMMPNWRLTFDGLTQIPIVKKYFRNVTVSHSYKSTYNIGNFGTNMGYFDSEHGAFGRNPDITETEDQVRGMLRDAENNFIPENYISSVSIDEQLSPLINFDMTWHNSLLTKFEIRKTRMLALSLNNNQLTETRNNDIVFGAGYKIKDVPLRLTPQGGDTKPIKSDMNVRFDLTVRDNVTILRSLSEDDQNERNVVSTGGRKFIISLTADYIFSEKVNVQFYFDRTVNNPYTSRTPNTAETNVGFSLRLSL